MMIKIEVQLRC